MARVPLPGLAVHAPPNPSAPPPLLPKSQSDYGPLESIYHAADDPSHGISVSIYSAADEHSSPPQDDIPPPLPERDIYESINGKQKINFVSNFKFLFVDISSELCLSFA